MKTAHQVARDWEAATQRQEAKLAGEAKRARAINANYLASRLEAEAKRLRAKRLATPPAGRGPDTA